MCARDRDLRLRKKIFDALRRGDFPPATKRPPTNPAIPRDSQADAACLSRPNCTRIILIEQVELIAWIPDKQICT